MTTPKPITFLDALNSRYGAEDTTEYEANAFLVGFGGKNARNNKKWEMVGMEKTRKQQSHHHRLQTIVLKDAMISRPEADAGVATETSTVTTATPTTATSSSSAAVESGSAAGPGEIKRAGLRATEVDLSGNFELTVDGINVIVSSIPSLQLLQLNRIPLLLSPVEREGLKERLLSEGRIELVKQVGASKEVIEMVGKVIPELPNAFLTTAAKNSDSSSASSFAPIPDLSSRLLSATWPNLKQIVLNGTGITSLMPLRGLNLPICEELHLDMNNIVSLFPTATESADEGTPSDSSSLRVAFAGLANVKIISLALNKLTNWCGDSGLHLLAVNAFPLLTSLFVGGNPLPNLPLEDLKKAKEEGGAAAATEASSSSSSSSIAQLSALLAKLVALDFSDCAQIDNHVVSLEAIRAFGPSIATLRVSYELLFANKSQFPTEAIARNMTIASLPSLVTLNRAVVRPKERVDAELYYVQRAISEIPELRQQQFFKPAADEKEEPVVVTDVSQLAPATAVEVSAMTFEQLTAGLLSTIASATEGEKAEKAKAITALIEKTVAQYPRYFELRQLYRHVILSQQARGGAGGGADGGASSGFMLDVTIRADACADQHKRLPATMTIQKVKVLAAALFSGLDAAFMEVSFWITAGRGDSVAVPIVLDNEMQTLGFYGVPSGAVVKIRDLKEKARK